MSFDEVSLQEIDEEVDEKTYKLSPEEMLAEVEAGQRVSISRHQPKWADTGWLETIPVPDGMPISLETIDSRWGGGYYEIRILRNGKYKKSIMVEIAGRPRNKDGKLAKNPDLEEQQDKGFGRIEEILALAKALAPTPAPQPASDIGVIWKILESANEKNTALLQRIIDQKASNSPGSPFDLGQLAESVKQIKELSGLFGGAEDSQIEEDGDQSWDMVSHIIGLLDKNSKNKKSDTFEDEETEDDEEMSVESMATAFQGLESEERSAVVGAVLQSMTPQERALAIRLYKGDDDSETESKPDEQPIDIS
ncbi:MAG: hypothetical protein QNJ97_25130 [Myxococcota bacterium]|nr:hypothetical protein [Myxococcota bacterium]